MFPGCIATNYQRYGLSWAGPANIPRTGVDLQGENMRGVHVELSHTDAEASDSQSIYQIKLTSDHWLWVSPVI